MCQRHILWITSECVKTQRQPPSPSLRPPGAAIELSTTIVATPVRPNSGTKQSYVAGLTAFVAMK